MFGPLDGVILGLLSRYKFPGFFGKKNPIPLKHTYLLRRTDEQVGTAVGSGMEGGGAAAIIG